MQYAFAAPFITFIAYIKEKKLPISNKILKDILIIRAMLFTDEHIG